MNRRQVGIGAAVAAALVLGANATTLDSAPATKLGMQSVPALRERMVSIVVRSCGSAAVPNATTFTMLEVCGERALGGALDVFGELAAQLKQL